MSTFESKKVITIEDALELDKKIFLAIKAFRLQSLGSVAIEAVADRLNLEPFLEFLTNFNGSNGAPYHNYYHSTCVFLNCYEGAWLAKLDDEETRGLCAGAMLHDFNHSAGSLPDSDNIVTALQGLKTAQTYAKSKLIGLSRRSYEIAEAVIKITQYPFTKDPETMPERIIRDADLMQPYEESPEQLFKQYIGLKKEIEIQRQIVYTRNEFAEGVKKFQDAETNWHTEWAVEKAASRNWEMAKSNLAKLISMSVQ